MSLRIHILILCLIGLCQITLAESVGDDAIGHSEVSIEFSEPFSGSSLTHKDSILSTSTLSHPYPNPAKDFVWVNYELSSQHENVELKVKNLIGNLLHEESLGESNGKLKLDTHNFQPGIYIIYLTDGKTIITTRRLVIVR